MSVPILSRSAEETGQWGKRLGESLQKPAVVVLLGDIGAGKTVFVQGLARGLGIDDRVVSPTYTLVREYQGRLPLFHVDLYRLESFDDLIDIGWDDYLASGGVLALEWGQRLENVWPPETVFVSLENHPEQAEWRYIICDHLGA